MTHLLRAGLLLAVVVIGFIYAKSMSTVVSVDFIGLTHDDNSRAWAQRTVNNQDATACVECHKDTNNAWQSSGPGSAHLGVGCETCHGSTADHMVKARAGQPAPLRLADAKDLCLTCHQKVVGRPDSFPQIEPALHVQQLGGSASNCISCHTPHNPGIPPALPHSLEGRSDCTVCHAADKWKPFPLDHAKISPNACLTCHHPKEGN
jgi:hypothetical protein